MISSLEPINDLKGQKLQEDSIDQVTKSKDEHKKVSLQGKEPKREKNYVTKEIQVPDRLISRNKEKEIYFNETNCGITLGEQAEFKLDAQASEEN